MIVITAATGEYGRLVVQHLLHRRDPSELAVAVRDPARAGDLRRRGVDVRYGDYEKRDSLRSAFEGADRVLFISAPTWDPTVRRPQHANVVEAARAAGVGLIAYTSAVGADHSDEGGLADHHYTEALLRESGLPHLILRNTLYSEQFIHPGLQEALDRGELTGSSGVRGLNTATRADLAEAAAVLLAESRVTTTEHDFTGPVWTYPELAEALSELSGRPVRYRDTDIDEGIMVMVGPMVRAGLLERQTPDLERALGHPATTLREAVSAALRGTRTAEPVS